MQKSKIFDLYAITGIPAVKRFPFEVLRNDTLVQVQTMTDRALFARLVGVNSSKKLKLHLCYIVYRFVAEKTGDRPSAASSSSICFKKSISNRNIQSVFAVRMAR